MKIGQQIRESIEILFAEAAADIDITGDEENPVRLELPGSWYHRAARGNEPKAIFRQDRARLHFLELLEQADEKPLGATGGTSGAG